MTISLSPATQKLLEEQMKRQGTASADEAVRVILETIGELEGPFFEDLDPATQAAIDEGLTEANRGEGRPWEEVREELRGQFILKK